MHLPVAVEGTHYYQDQAIVDSEGNNRHINHTEVIYTNIGGTMTERSRIRFNPVTSEIEVEGTEEFVKTYFA